VPLAGAAIDIRESDYPAFTPDTRKTVTETSIPCSVTRIRADSFRGCTNLLTVTFENGSILSDIGPHAFAGCSSLKSIHLPAPVQTIGEGAFAGCTSLASVTFDPHSGLLGIQKSAFSGCSSLSSILIPSTVQVIGESAFQGCRDLSMVTFGDDSKLFSIEDKAFQDCESLKSISIPRELEDLSGLALAGAKLSQISVAHDNCHFTISGDFLLNFECTSLIFSVGHHAGSLMAVTIAKEIRNLAVGSFAHGHYLSHVFFDSGSHLLEIGDFAFFDSPYFHQSQFLHRSSGLGKSASLIATLLPTSYSNRLLSSCFLRNGLSRIVRRCHQFAFLPRSSGYCATVSTPVPPF
jgi:hypothetical protein